MLTHQLASPKFDALTIADMGLYLLNKKQLANKLGEGAGLTMSQIREILNTTRKYAVPYCEYLDRTGFTQREGDLRVLAASTTTS